MQNSRGPISGKAEGRFRFPGGQRGIASWSAMPGRAVLSTPSARRRQRRPGSRWLVAVLALCLALVASCSAPAAGKAPAAGSAPAAVPKPPVDFAAMEAAIETQIATGSVMLDRVRVVLVSVEGQTRISHYRHGFTATDRTHVWGVTLGVVSTLIGIALSEGIITSLDQRLEELLPRHRRAMSPEVAAVTLRQLMTMSAGFVDPESNPVELFDPDRNLVEHLLTRAHVPGAGNQFEFSNVSAHLTSAVLAAALQRSDGEHPRSVLGYARERLFHPLGIDTRPAFTKPVSDPDTNRDFERAGFGWLTDPQGISNGALGLRLTAPDLLKLGELYLRDGVWDGKQIVPADWIRQARTPSEKKVDFGLLWWTFSWNGQEVLAARGLAGHLIAIVPGQRMVTVISSDRLVDGQLLFPLVTGVVMPALAE